MNIDLSKYERMRDDGASRLEIIRQLRADGVNGVDVYTVLSAVVSGLTSDTARTFFKDELGTGNGRTIIDWPVPDTPEIRNLA